MALTFLGIFLSGALAKLADDHEGKILSTAGGIVSGALGVISALLLPEILPLALGAILGVLLAGKVDKLPHYANVATFMTIYALAPITVPLIPLAVFTACAYIDERLSGREGILGKRIILPSMAAMYSLITANAIPILAQLLWDGGYVMVGYVYRNLRAS